MLVVLLLTIGILVAFAAIASIGLFFKREPIKGSCGGLSALGIQRACDCKEPCDNAKKSMAEQQKAEQAQASNPEASLSSFSQASTGDYTNDRTGEGVYKA